MSAAFAWLPVVVPPIAWIIGYDVWAKSTRHWTLSRQLHDWAFNPTIGPIIVAVGGGGLIWFVLHILRYHAHS